MHRGDSEVQVWQRDDYPPPPSPNHHLSLLTSPSSCLLSVNIHFLSPRPFPWFTYLSLCLSAVHFSPFSPPASKIIDSLFFGLHIALFPPHSLASHSSFANCFSLHVFCFPSSLSVPSLSPSLIPFPLNLFFYPLSFHFLPSIPLCPKLSLFCHPSLFLSVTSVLSHRLTRIRWVLSSVPLLGPPLPPLSPPFHCFSSLRLCHFMWNWAVKLCR